MSSHPSCEPEATEASPASASAIRLPLSGGYESPDENEERMRALKRPRRERVSLACDVCRARKSRCSGGRPCQYCSDKQIECTDFGSKRRSINEDTLTQTLDWILERTQHFEEWKQSVSVRLTEIEQSIRAERQSMNALPEPMIPEMPGLSPGHHAQAPGHFHDVSQYCASDHSSFSKERDTLAEVATTPSLLNLAADYEHLKQSDHVELRTSQPGGRMSPLHVIQLLIRDFDVKSCNEKEEAAAQKLLAADVPLDNIDLDRMTCKRLCDEYFQKVNYWLPILSQERWMKEFEKAQSTNFQGNTMSEAVIFLTLALGAASTVDDPVNVAGQICGRKYFLRGLSTLGRNGIFTANLQTIQCKFFVSLYCLFALQPRPAAVAISEAAHLCEYLREYPSRRVLEGEDRDYHLRAFWCCAMLEGEIKVHLRGRRSGISQSLNLNRDWPQLAVDRQSLFFLAESQIRQMKQDIDCDLRAGPEFIFKPLLMKEHFNQLDQWYKILPEELMFNAEKAQDLFDDRKAFLRMQYHCARTSIATSAIFGSKDSERGFGSVTEETLFQHDQERNMYAQRYVNSAIQVLLGAPEQLFRRTIMTYLICEATIGVATKLLIAMQVPTVHRMCPNNTVEIIRSTIRALEPWHSCTRIEKGCDALLTVLDAIDR